VTEQKHYDLIERTSQPHFGLVHAFYAIMGGFAFYGFDSDDTTRNAGDSLFELAPDPRYTIDVPEPRTLLYIMKYFPHIITDTTEESILDRAESSGLSKALLIVQVGWFCMNCASRLFQRLSLSLLEVSTAAHAFCTLLTYFVWWSKPVNIAVPTIMKGKEAREVYALLKCSHAEYNEALEIAQKAAAGDSSTLTEIHGSKKIVLAANAVQCLLPTPERPPIFSRVSSRHTLIPGSFETGSREVGFYESTTMAISPILYGLVHFLAWSDQFPTLLERLLWRVSSAVVTCSGLVAVLLIRLSQLLDERHSGFIYMVRVLCRRVIGFMLGRRFVCLLAPGVSLPGRAVESGSELIALGGGLQGMGRGEKTRYRVSPIRYPD
jgi:hypothetical protein